MILGGEADLSLSKIDALDPVTMGDNITYTLTVNNSGPDSAQNVILTDNLPGSLDYPSVTPGQDSCSELSGVVICNLGELSNGYSTSIEIIDTTTSAGTLTNNASVTAGEIPARAITVTVKPPQSLQYLDRRPI